MYSDKFVIEEESGTTTGAHPHNGYYAGDFSQLPVNAVPVRDGRPMSMQLAAS